MEESRNVQAQPTEQERKAPAMGQPVRAAGHTEKDQVASSGIKSQNDKQTDVVQAGSESGVAQVIAPTLSDVLKVWTLKNDKIEGKVVATLPMEDLGKAPTLKAVRSMLGTKITPEQEFCYQDGSPAEEDALLEKYLHVDEINTKPLGKVQKLDADNKPEQEPPKLRKLYVAAPAEVPVTKETTSSILSEPAFSVKVLEWEVQSGDNAKAGVLTSRGTVLSKQFDKTPSPPELTLAELRLKLSKLPSMSSSSKIHKFCTPSGTTVSDETTSFLDYLRLEEMEVKDKPDLPSVDVVYKRASFLNQPKVDMANMPGAYKPDSLKLNEKLFDGQKVAEASELEKARTALGEEKDWTPAGGALEKDSAGFLTELQWKVVLQNCGVMHGWIVDRQKNRIVQAPRSAFQMRTKRSSDQTTTSSSAAKPANNDQGKESRSEKAEKTTEKDNKVTAVPAEVAKELELREDILPPGIPSFRVNDNSRVEVTLSSHEFETSMAKNDFSSQSTEASLSGGYAGFSASVSGGYSNSKSNTNKATVNVYKKTMIASYMFPRADIILHPEDLEPTPELKAALSKIAKHKNIRDLRKLYQDFGQVFCRQVTVGGRLQSTKVMQDQSMKTEQEEKEQFKVSVGVQVSTPIGVGAGVKHENEKGNSASKQSGDQKRQESNVFEAVGGDTILASAPLLWIPSVAKFWNWRVISREELTPLVDTISAMAGHAEVKNYFVQAVPVLSKYIELSDGHEVKSRLRLVSNQRCLSKSYLDKTKDIARFDDPVYYLGHIPNSVVAPRYLGLKDALKDFWGDMVQYSGEPPMFTPTSYRAPAILGYDSENVSGPSMAYNQDFLNTVWSITAPFSESLQHGCRVCLTTVPLQTSVEAPAAVNFAPAPPPASHDNIPPTAVQKSPAPAPLKSVVVTTQSPSSLVVFRNQQGVFLPGMSSSDESQYWRIMKVGALQIGENIQEGDTVRLYWTFADQTTGFRDFVDDIYGRRRNHCPPEMASSVLYLKLPWPRFEDIKQQTGTGVGSNAMVMSTEPGQEDCWTEIVSRPQLARNATGTSAYALQDVSFCIDTVANNGRGDTGDYLLPSTVDADAPVSSLEYRQTVADLARKQIEAQQKLMEKVLFLDANKI